MQRESDALPLWTRLLHDLSSLAVLSLILIPVYLLLNQYWKSLVMLTVGYAALGFAFLRLGRYIRRVIRRLPAEIPPWQPPLRQVSARPPPDLQFAAAEAIRHVSTDPHYLEEVFKPRLRQLLAYRLCGNPHKPLEALDATYRTHLEPAVLAVLETQGDTGFWSRYRHRQQRLQDVLHVLRYLETL